MKTTILSLFLAAMTAGQSIPPGGNRPLLASDDSGATIYPVRKLYFPSGTLSCAAATCTYAGGGSAGTAPYSLAFAASTSETVTAATHGQGTTPMDGGCYTAAGLRRFPDTWTRNGSGDVTITFPAAFTGACGVFNGSGGGGGPGTVTTGAGLTGDGSSGDPVRIDSSGGAASQASYSASLTSWGTIGAAACVEKSITATGVTAGDTLAAAYPATIPAGLVGMMYAASDVVVVRLCNVTAAGVTVSDGLTFTARVISGF